MRGADLFVEGLGVEASFEPVLPLSREAFVPLVLPLRFDSSGRVVLRLVFLRGGDAIPLSSRNLLFRLSVLGPK
jgi:hypothetical protein